MNKIGLIIQREYLTRVKKRSFLVTTLLLPILIFVVIAGITIAIAASDRTQKVLIWDETGNYSQRFDSSSKTYHYAYIDNNQGKSDADLLKQYEGDLLVHIFPTRINLPDSAVIFKEGGVNMAVKEHLSSVMNDIWQERQLKQAGIDIQQLDQIKNQSVIIRSYDIEKKQETDADITSGIAYFMGFLIYMVIFIYGSGVMRGVMEEKTSRIAEVIISSVKPFELMMGKIIGIALVGLTQLALWGILLFVLQWVAVLFIPDIAQVMQMARTAQEGVGTGAMQSGVNMESVGMMQGLFNQHWGLIIFSFLFYFLGGYFLYAALFAAVGSLVNEDPQDAQQFTLPVTLPIIVGFMIMTSSASNPDSTISVIASIVPFTSPIVMLSRIPFGVPVWQLVLSMSFLVLGFVLMTWLSAKIYRTGILMYGKKITWKELWKWLRY